MIGAALKEEKSSRQKFVSGETTVGKSSMALVGLLGRVGGPFKPPSRDGCDLATVAPLLLATGADMVGFKTPHRCPQLAVENPFSPLRLLSPPSRLIRAIRDDRVVGRVGQVSSLISRGKFEAWWNLINALIKCLVNMKKKCLTMICGLITGKDRG